MTPVLWIALGFTAVLVVFLMLTYFMRDRSTPNQHNTLRFLTSLCSGFAAGFFTGGALFQLEQHLSNGAKLGISGTAGFALFFIVWFSYGDWKPPDGGGTGSVTINIHISLPAGWTFEQAVRAAVENRGGICFEGFSKDQLNVRMQAADFYAEDIQSALLKLRDAAGQPLPDYAVTFVGGVFLIKAQEVLYAGQEHV